MEVVAIPIGKEITRGAAFTIGSVLVIIALVIGSQFFGLGFLDFGGEGETPQQQYALQLPIKFTVRDQIAGGALTSGTIYIYDSAGEKLLETVTYSNGWETAQAYTSGDNIKLFYANSGYLAAPVDFSVPYASSEYQSYFYAAIDVVHRPGDSQLSISIMDNTGNQVATESAQDGAQMDSDGTLDLTIHLVVTEGYGLISFEDLYEDEMDAVLLVLKINTTLATISGISAERKEYGGYTYYYWQIEDLLATKDDPATRDIQFTLNWAGTSGIITLQAFLYTEVDPSLFGSSLTADSDSFSDNTVALQVSPAS